MDADLRLLRYFVAVAEELSFTRAAERLHIAQQPLSAAIRRFEQGLGVALFVRTTRRVELTAAGEAMLAPARAAIRAADDALAAAGQQTVAGRVVVGLASGARYAVTRAFAALAQRHPAVELELHHGSTQPLLDSLHAGQLDLAVTFAAVLPPTENHHRLADERAVLAVAATHPLARRERIALAELSEETFALDLPGDNPGYNAAVMDACRRAGFEPATRVDTAAHDAWESLVHSGTCVGLTARSALHAAHRELRLIDLEDPVAFAIDVVAATGEPRPPVASTLATLLEHRDGRHPGGADPPLRDPR